MLCVMYSSQCYIYINVLCVCYVLCTVHSVIFILMSCVLCYVLCTVHSVIFILMSCVYVMCYVQFTVLYLY